MSVSDWHLVTLLSIIFLLTLPSTFVTHHILRNHPEESDRSDDANERNPALLIGNDDSAMVADNEDSSIQDADGLMPRSDEESEEIADEGIVANEDTIGDRPKPSWFPPGKRVALHPIRRNLGVGDALLPAPLHPQRARLSIAKLKRGEVPEKEAPSTPGSRQTLPELSDEALATVDPFYWVIKSAREKGLPLADNTPFTFHYLFYDYYYEVTNPPREEKPQPPPPPPPPAPPMLTSTTKSTPASKISTTKPPPISPQTQSSTKAPTLKTVKPKVSISPSTRVKIFPEIKTTASTTTLRTMPTLEPTSKATSKIISASRPTTHKKPFEITTPKFITKQPVTITSRLLSTKLPTFYRPTSISTRRTTSHVDIPTAHTTLEKSSTYKSEMVKNAKPSVKMKATTPETPSGTTCPHVFVDRQEDLKFKHE